MNTGTYCLTYDALNRLTQAKLDQILTFSVGYGDGGNITGKSEPGGYTYLSSRPHAVSQTTTSCGLCCTITRNYGYDANGNMTNRDGAAITWTSFNKPKVINLTGSNCSGDCTTFTYGPDRRPGLPRYPGYLPEQDRTVSRTPSD